MNFIEKLEALKEKTGDNNNTLSIKTGIPYSTIDNLKKKGYQNIKLSTLEKLCLYFNVTLDYLALDDNDEESNNEQRMLNAFKALNNEGQSVVIEYAEMCAQNVKYQKKEERKLG